MSLRTDQLRVAFCVDNLGIGGTELNAVRTAESLVARGVQLRLISLQADGPLLERYRRLAIPLHFLTIPSFRHPLILVRVASLLRILDHYGVNVVHAHDVYSTCFAMAPARLARSRLLLASRRWGVASEPPHLRWMLRRSYSLADRILCNSSEVRGELVDLLPAVAARAEVIPNFVSVSDTADLANEDRRQWRKDTFGAAEVVVVGSLSRLSAIKDLPTALQAFAVAHRSAPQLRFAICGDGPERQRLEEDAVRLGIASSVRFLGEVLPGCGIQRHFDVFLLTSLSEGSPNALLEALALGVSAIATRVGGVTELIEDHVNGILVVPGDIASIASAIYHLVTRPELRAAMGTAARQRAIRMHSERVVIDRLLRAYGAADIPVEAPHHSALRAGH